MGGRSRHGIVNIVFLPQPPEVHKVRYAVENMVAAPQLERPGQGELGSRPEPAMVRIMVAEHGVAKIADKSGTSAGCVHQSPAAPAT